MYYLLENDPLFLLRYTLATPAPATAIPPAVAARSKKIEPWIIVVVAAIGGLVFLVLVCAIIACCGRRRKKKKGEKRSAQAVPSYGTCGTCNEILLPELYHLCQTISQRHVGKMLVNSATLS